MPRRPTGNTANCKAQGDRITLTCAAHWTENGRAMAEKLVVRWVDDLTGEEVPGDQIRTVRFGLDGAEYEIDLGPESLERLRSALAEYIAAARRARGSRRGRSAEPRTAPGRRSAESAEARAWLKANGYQVPDRGRLSRDLLEVWRQNKDRPRVDEGADAAETAGDASGEERELDTSDAAVLAWHEVKGYKVPADGKVNGLMRHRYLKEHGAA